MLIVFVIAGEPYLPSTHTLLLNPIDLLTYYIISDCNYRYMAVETHLYVDIV